MNDKKLKIPHFDKFYTRGKETKKRVFTVSPLIEAFEKEINKQEKKVQVKQVKKQKNSWQSEKETRRNK